MGKKRSAGEAPAAPARPFHDAFAKLRERLPEGYTPPAPTPPPAQRGEGSTPGQGPHHPNSPLHAKRGEGSTPGQGPHSPNSPLHAQRGEGSTPGQGPHSPNSPLHAKRGEGSGEGPARAVVRIERKGRGGKEATLVEKLDLPAPTLAAWLDEAKRSLGCGGALEGGALVLQGDQRARVARWLEQRGVRKVTVGT